MHCRLCFLFFAAGAKCRSLLDTCWTYPLDYLLELPDKVICESYQLKLSARAIPSWATFWSCLKERRTGTIPAWSSAGETFWNYLMKLPGGVPAEAHFWSFLLSLKERNYLELPAGLSAGVTSRPIRWSYVLAGATCRIYLSCLWAICRSYLSYLWATGRSYLSYVWATCRNYLSCLWATCRSYLSYLLLPFPT